MTIHFTCSTRTTVYADLEYLHIKLCNVGYTLCIATHSYTSKCSPPSMVFPDPSSTSTKPAGQFTADSMVNIWLWNANVALVNTTTLSGFSISGL